MGHHVFHVDPYYLKCTYVVFKVHVQGHASEVHY